MKPVGEHIDVSTQELEALLERATQEPLQPDGYQKLKAAIRTLGYVTELLENREATLETLRRLLCQSSTEKTGKVLQQAGLEWPRRIMNQLTTVPTRRGLLDMDETVPPLIAERVRFRFGMRR